MTQPAKHWINGEWMDSGPLRDSINPATGATFATFHDGGLAEARQAVAAARQVFLDSDWKVDAMRRSTALSHLADAYEQRSEEIIDCLAMENGKLKIEAGFEAMQIVRALRFAAGLALYTFGRVAEPRPGTQSMALRQAVGVAGLIVPWNSPAFLLIRALAPALAAGCTAVIKLPAQAAQSAWLSAQILASVPEIPRGAINIFIESGAEGAKFLVDSPDVPVINFTGSTSTGRLIAAAGAAHFKRIGLELGGKTPHLVFDDADLEAAVPAIVASSTVFAGQFCVTGSRILVQRGIAQKLKDLLTQRLSAVQPGPAADPASQMGPLIDREAAEGVDRKVEAALEEGATAIVRGGLISQGPLAGGAFYRPTLLEVPAAGLAISREEVFGPVQTLQVFDSEDEAIAMANDSEYGLSACIWSRDVNRPIRVARQLEAGHICINDWAGMQVEFEEGGFKNSGQGRLGGLACLDDFMEYKQILQVFRQP
ncbi:aldehyde dehydrogenase family protein [Pseudomonas gingeri]|uniref:aldehyde dehydrogenase family protein n=1 Tax=Pseudomonas gingeri TaxID=117681 RepID=UPI0015A412AC|nr:aldehyde dehydrogenase family protein [Pseudomonas gingeri]NWD08783.1 aldehyde dehydrogenase family protein [Pseudomonas gingeri]NWE34367.1 aldehyde dehydrogenase family protein [Pseudomonas gingeri]NWE56452.1 aldehyde dehydrogenase family protein [Pseudomonas gingeri]NWF05492.1 aldehyde dehydrogenase family protein [Pseudomonas gingeri]